MRPARKARGGRIPGVCNRRATQRPGMQRRPNVTRLLIRGTSVLNSAFTVRRTDLRLRSATPDDTEVLTALINRAYRVEDFFKHGDRVSAGDVRAKMGRGQFLILEDDAGAVAGAVYVQLNGERTYFGLLSVDPARQKQGLGATLVAAAETWGRDAGCREMEIEVVSLRTELPPFYRRLGYVEAGTRPFNDPSKMPCHFIVMTKPLRIPNP
jgi:GNAT superfamily N-acetyltransferase